eukprot:gene349-biopygen287
MFLALDTRSRCYESHIGKGNVAQSIFFGWCILAWFRAAGFTKAQVLQLVKEHEKHCFERIWTHLKQRRKANGIRQFYAFGPLPTCIVVSLRDDGINDVAMFRATEQSARVTVQRLNMMIATLQVPMTEYNIDDVIRKGISGRNNDMEINPQFLSHALIFFARNVGGCLARDAHPDAPFVRVRHLQGGSVRKVDMRGLLERYSVVADFTGQLSRSKRDKYLF